MWRMNIAISKGQILPPIMVSISRTLQEKCLTLNALHLKNGWFTQKKVEKKAVSPLSFNIFSIFAPFLTALSQLSYISK